MLRTTLTALVAIGSSLVFAHDTWIETNTSIIRCADAVYLDLCLGNHGNQHRDFKIAGKTDLDGCAFSVRAPDGSNYDLLDRLFDTGYAPKEGFWRCKFAASEPGLYLANHTRDKVVNHGRSIRAIKSGKAFFAVCRSLDRIPVEQSGYDHIVGAPLEIIPRSNPVISMGPGRSIAVQVLFQGKPLIGDRIAFIPRGETLRDDFDERYERITDADGMASFTPDTGNQYLVVVHHETAEGGEGYEATSYSATLTLFVPDICPCCSDN